MPVKSTFTGPSITEEKVIRTIFDPNPDDSIAILRTEVTSVNGSAPGSQPDWVTFNVQPQQTVNGRAVREVEIIFDITGLRLNSVHQFEYEIEASDGRTSSTHTYENTFDDLTSAGGKRVTWIDFDTLVGKADPIDDPAGPYQVVRYPNLANGVNVQSGDTEDGGWEYNMNNGMEIDPDPGYMFVKEIVDTEGFDDERVRIIRINLGTDEYTGVTPTRGTAGWDIDPINEHIYFLWPQTQGWNPPDGAGIYRNDYNGNNREKIADNFAGDFQRDCPDMEVDVASDTMIIVGQRLLTLEYSIIKTSVTNPDNDITQTVETSASPSGQVWVVDVDWGAGLVFTVESDGSHIVRRQLSDLSIDQQYNIGGDTGDIYGMMVNPVDQRIWFVRNNTMYSAPYSDISNTTVEAEGLPHFPTFNQTNDTNAHPRWDHKLDVQWRK